MLVVTCEKCGSKNRVEPQSAKLQIAKCGKCGTILDMTRTSAAPAKPITITDASFQQEVLSANDTILLDCWAPWCGPCRMIAPVMDQLAAEANGRYRVGKLNVDENPRIASQFQVQSIPTMLIFRKGEMVDRLVGAQPKDAIAARLLRHT